MGLPVLLDSRTALPDIPEDKSCQFMVGSSDQDLIYALVNKERVRRRLNPLKRSIELEQQALVHATEMLKQRDVFHSVKSISKLREKLGSHYCGENVNRGTCSYANREPCLEEMHKKTMAASKRSSTRMNILSRMFTNMGCATVVGDNKKVYLCLFFRGFSAEEVEPSNENRVMNAIAESNQ
jgi:uncharacterized protein YkwD